MATRHVTVRLDADVVGRLDARSQSTERKRPELITRYVDEGMRMEDHPGIVFRSGPAGRRAGLAAGPDVWEVMRVVRNVEGSGEAAVTEAAEWLSLAREQIDSAVRYYSEYPDEVDRWIDRVDEEARRAQQIWQRRQDALA
ncbi:MAG: hypothetical protein WD250_01785 [Egibacteraceae bacterium]